jgi:colanic acid/amylovoran biosynthesis protein
MAPRSIVVWSGSLPLLNYGDVAMLQVAVRCLKGCFPKHRIRVFTRRPELLARYCPQAEALDSAKIRLGFCDGLRTYVRAVVEGRAADRQQARQLIAETDAVVAAGGGYINDHFPTEATRIMNELRIAASRGIPIAMFSQGLGPATQPEILCHAKRLFPRLSLLALRESVRGPRLAAQWGARESQLVVTGDDAIASAYERRPAALGAHIGLGIRISEYSGVTHKQAEEITHSLPQPLLPVAISRFPHESDEAALSQLLGFPSHSDSPESVMEAVGRCRVVVAGSYHAAVFALAQGIPAVGLAANEYYHGKMEGLTGQFGPGVKVVRLDLPGYRERLACAVQDLWDAAPNLRDGLLASARCQIARSQKAYSGFANRLTGQSGPSRCEPARFDKMAS